MKKKNSLGRAQPLFSYANDLGWNNFLLLHKKCTVLQIQTLRLTKSMTAVHYEVTYMHNAVVWKSGRQLVVTYFN